jgi:hypothetical protein
MENRTLLQSQKNDVFSLISDSDLDPKDFEWTKIAGGYTSQVAEVSRLIHKPSNFFFTFDYLPTAAHFARYSPGKETPTEDKQAGTWHKQQEILCKWLNYLKREIESPDLWEAIAQESALLDEASASSSNEQFSDEEKSYIINGLNEIKQYLLIAHNLDPELVESKINYLVEASGRLGHKDWIIILVGTLISIVSAAYLPPETTRDIFRFVGTVLRDLFGGGHLLLI